MLEPALDAVSSDAGTAHSRHCAQESAGLEPHAHVIVGLPGAHFPAVHGALVLNENLQRRPDMLLQETRPDLVAEVDEPLRALPLYLGWDLSGHPCRRRSRARRITKH